MNKKNTKSSPMVLLVRTLIAFIVVFSTYNPSGKSIYHWVTSQPSITDAWVVLVMVVAALLNIALLVAAWKGMGYLGTVLAITLFAAIVYLSLQEQWVGTNGKSFIWFGLTLYSIYLGFGLAGAILYRRGTGQVSVEDSDE